MQDNNVHTVGDLQYLVPSLSTNTITSRDAIYLNIRGQGISAASLPGVMMYLNEVPVPLTSNVGTAAGVVLGDAGAVEEGPAFLAVFDVALLLEDTDSGENGSVSERR